MLSKKQYWLRKRFGRFIFTNILINYFQIKNIEKHTEKLFRKEINTIKDYLPKKVENIMDIGCGLGIINIYLNEIYNNQPNFFLLDKNKIDKKINLVISLKSMGYHYPVEHYLKLFRICCDDNTFFIFDVSDEYYNVSLLIEYFDFIDIIYEEKSIHSLKRLFCTNFKK